MLGHGERVPIYDNVSPSVLQYQAETYFDNTPNYYSNQPKPKLC